MEQKTLIEFFPRLKMHPALLEELAEHCVLRTFQAGDVLLSEGAYVQLIPLLIRGLVKVYKEEEDGNEVLLYYIEPGQSCIVSFVTRLKNEKSTVRAVVEEGSQIILLPADKNQELIVRYPEWNNFFLELFSSKYQELLHFIGVLTFSNKDKLLREYLNREVELRKDSILKITHQKIASDLGSSREVISRLLKKLEKEGYLRLSHGTIELL